MQASTRLQLEQSTLNEQINARLAADSMTDAERTELQTWTKRSQEVEVELRAALLVEDTDDHQVVDVADLDNEQRERIALRSKAKCHQLRVGGGARQGAGPARRPSSRRQRV